MGMRHRLALGLIAALPLLVACAAPAADAPARDGTAATATSRSSLPMCRACRLLEAPRGTAPASCPATPPPDPPFVPPAPYPPTPPSVVEDKFWYGTNRLWTWQNADGTWPMVKERNGVRFDKSFWWRQGYDWRTETTPRLWVTGRRLDALAPAVTISDATNGSNSTWARSCCWGWSFRAGCWELTGHYAGGSLRFVVWVS